MFFSLNSWLLALVLVGILFGAVALGLLAGRALSHHAETLREPFGVVQAALLTLVGLLLAFTLAMAVTRYEARRAAVVDDSNAIGTAYLRAQTLHEPMRSASLRLYPDYADASIALSNSVPGSGDAKRAIADESRIQRQLWSLAGQSLAGRPRRLRAAALRREPQCDDRHADDARRGAQQPGSAGDLARRAGRRRRRARP